MKNVLNIISIISFVLFVAWFISEPSYEPGIGVLLSIASLLSIFYIDKINTIKKIVYKINVRGYGEKQLITLINCITDEFFEISKFRYKMVDGDWYDIIFEAKERISHKDIFEFVRTNPSGDYWKIYEVSGEGESYGLTDGELPICYHKN